MIMQEKRNSTVSLVIKNEKAVVEHSVNTKNGSSILFLNFDNNQLNNASPIVIESSSLFQFNKGSSVKLDGFIVSDPSTKEIKITPTKINIL